MNTASNFKWKVLPAVMAAAFLAGCGGGGDDDDNNVPAAVQAAEEVGGQVSVHAQSLDPLVGRVGSLSEAGRLVAE